MKLYQALLFVEALTVFASFASAGPLRLVERDDEEVSLARRDNGDAALERRLLPHIPVILGAGIGIGVLNHKRKKHKKEKERLQQENAQLQGQLAAGPQGGAPPAPAGGAPPTPGT